MKEYLHSKEDVLEKVKSQESGLTFEEAKNDWKRTAEINLPRAKKKALFISF